MLGPPAQIGALSWNLFHGRDFPPDPALLTRRSRLLRISERDSTHIQVNRNLFHEFAGLIAGWEWDVALLQECPPRWRDPLASACNAEAISSLTSRNSLPHLRRALAALNPDLIGSNEGGSNLLLVRGTLGRIVGRRELVLTPGTRPERRTMVFAKLECGLCVACLHASAGPALRPEAEREVLAAAAVVSDWAKGRPLLLGGDFNLRPRDTDVFEQLDERFGLAASTGPTSLDHLLAANLAAISPPTAVPGPGREVIDRSSLAIRLSDHAPVSARFAPPEGIAAASRERG